MAKRPDSQRVPREAPSVVIGHNEQVRLLLLLAFLGVVAVAAGGAHAEEGPPPPPAVLDEWYEEPAPVPEPSEPDVVPVTPVPPAKPAPVTPAPEPSTTTTTLPELPLLGGPFLGAVVGGVGSALGAAGGAVVLWSGAAAALPDLALFAVVVSTPALAALVAGLLVVALIVPHPGIDDFTSVVACSAVGCLGTWLILALAIGGGASGCNPGGCGNGCGSGDPFGGSGGGGDNRGMPAAAAAGIGAIVGLGAGALVGLGYDDSSQTPMKLGASVGLVDGGLIGGAVGGFIVGMGDDSR